METRIAESPEEVDEAHPPPRALDTETLPDTTVGTLCPEDHSTEASSPRARKETSPGSPDALTRYLAAACAAIPDRPFRKPHWLARSSLTLR
jgi:hypothetical protein